MSTRYTLWHTGCSRSSGSWAEQCSCQGFLHRLEPSAPKAATWNYAMFVLPIWLTLGLEWSLVSVTRETTVHQSEWLGCTKSNNVLNWTDEKMKEEAWLRVHLIATLPQNPGTRWRNRIQPSNLLILAIEDENLIFRSVFGGFQN